VFVALSSLILVLFIAGIAFVSGGAGFSRTILGTVLPYVAIATFLAGIVYQVLKWASSPVPFHIPTTCGQQKSLPWIKSSWLESPHNKLGTAARVAVETLLFRSLFRNSRARLEEGPKLVFSENKYLWLAAIAFHWSLLVILLRHLRFFVEPMPVFVMTLAKLDGFFQVGTPPFFVSDLLIVAGLLYLLQRRFLDSQVRYLSLFTDYFALLLVLGIAISGILMRNFFKVDLEGVKQLALGLVVFHPMIPAGVSRLFFVHLTLVSVLFAYFPFSKLVHMGGIFLSPTRNLANNSRMQRHVNPWDYPVKVHSYEEWEEEFRDRIIAAGLPLESDGESSARAGAEKSSALQKE
jgi:[DsrC]-trisulfide reductase subunit M